jgi:Zn-dependent peptidase ImmA (M78 family)/transcriptional regulator with XRE-family HTH domain
LAVTERIPVSAEVLAWARRSAGLADASVAARKLGVSESTLGKWEAGGLSPTIKQLRIAAKVYRRPLAVLLLPEPPRDFDAVRDFRKRAGGSKEWSPALHSEFRRALSQREVFLELAELSAASIQPEGELPRIQSDAPVEEAASTLRYAIGVEPGQSWSSYDALNVFVAAVERLGILVIHTRDVSVDEVRGFSLSEHPFPLIALNGSDWPRPRLFTLLHEMTHLAIRASGLCDLHEARSQAAWSEDDELEHYCNRVAAAVLMPEPAIRAIASGPEEHDWPLDELRLISRRFGPSSEAVLLRLVSLGLATWDLYWTRKAELDRAYEVARQEEAARRRERAGGPNYYVVKARDLGHGYVASVLDAFRSRAITSLDVADYLEVKFDQLPKLERVLR